MNSKKEIMQHLKDNNIKLEHAKIFNIAGDYTLIVKKIITLELGHTLEELRKKLMDICAVYPDKCIDCYFFNDTTETCVIDEVLKGE